MIEEFFKQERKAVEKQLKIFFEDFERNEKDLLFNDFVEQLREFILPKKAKAKRIHPILMIAAFNGIINPLYLEDSLNEIHKSSIAVELLHSGHLIHDDLIDESQTRRNKPTFHNQLKESIGQVYKSMNLEMKNQKAKSYGSDLSVLGGSLGYFLGLDVLKSSTFPEDLKLLAIKEYIEGLEYLMKGQIIEEYMDYHNMTMSLEQYLNIAEMQRARMFEKSVKMGAILAKGNIHYQIKPLSEAMLKIGQAYAIRDDILDLEEDITAKKKKFIYILAVQNTDEEQSKILNEIYHLPEVSKSDVKEVEKIFAETNALIIAEHFSKNLIEQAKTNLKDIYPDLNKQQKNFFYEFSDFIYMRDF